MISSFFFSGFSWLAGELVSVCEVQLHPTILNGLSDDLKKILRSERALRSTGPRSYGDILLNCN